MEYLSEEEIKRIEKELSFRIIKLYGLINECLLYGITNLYTFIQEHEGNKLQKKGKSKAKRFELNQINPALLVTKEYGILLIHHTTRETGMTRRSSRSSSVNSWAGSRTSTKTGITFLWYLTKEITSKIA